MQSIAETMAIRSKKSQPTQRFLFQRQLMDGGACEATAFAAFGFRSAGLSLPLRNYHNIGPSDRPKPEEIHERDAERLVGFLVALMRAHRKSHLGDTQLRRLAFAERSKRIRASFTKHRRYFGGI
jgi:endoglucanase